MNLDYTTAHQIHPEQGLPDDVNSYAHVLIKGTKNPLSSVARKLTGLSYEYRVVARHTKHVEWF